MAEGIPTADFRRCVKSLGKPSHHWRLPGPFVEMEDAVELLVLSCYYGFEEFSNSFRCQLQPDGKAVVQRDQMKPKLPVHQRASK